MQCKGIFLPSRKISEIWFRTSNSCSFAPKHCRKYSNSRNPYDVLGLKTTCSTQDVKKAYIKLCKELHPDMKPGDTSQHKKFVELNNAYTTLIDSENRKHFDTKSGGTPHEFYQGAYKGASGPFEEGSRQKEGAWYETEDYQQYYKQNKYSNTTNRIGTKLILFGCFLLVTVGSFLYYFAYSYATRYTLERVDVKSRKISENYQDTRKNALDGGREEQIEKLKRRWSM